jgi:hypothetical protein
VSEFTESVELLYGVVDEVRNEAPVKIRECERTGDCSGIRLFGNS